MNFDLVKYNDLEALEEKFKSNPNYAAYMMEVIQGEAGIYVPDDGYLTGVRKLCDKYNVLLFCDEIQTGLGRTGKLLACNWEDVKPDILTLGKSLSGGFLPASATITSKAVMDVMGYFFSLILGQTNTGPPLEATLLLPRYAPLPLMFSSMRVL